MTNEGRTYSFTLQKSPWLINAPPLPRPPLPSLSPRSNHPLIFTAVPLLLFLFLYSLSTRPHSFRCICTHVRIQPSPIYIYIYILKVNRSMHDARCTMFSHLSRVKKIKNKKEKISLKFYLSHHPAERS